MTVFWPAVSPRVTEEAGTRGGTHAGMDLAAKLNDPVLAAFDGEVVYVGGDGASGSIQVGPKSYVYANGEGKTVDIRRADGLISRVGHLNGYAVKVGQRVNAGDVIGYAGTTGFSTGVHIHWELRWDRAWSGGAWVNPRDFDPQVFIKSTPAGQEEVEDMWKPTVHLRVTNQGKLIEGTLAHPMIGVDLRPGEKRVEKTSAGEANVYRGFKASASEAVVSGWRAAYAPQGNENSPGAKTAAAYQNMQAAQQQMSIDLYGLDGTQGK